MSREKRLEEAAKARGLRLRRSRSGKFRVQDVVGFKRSAYMSLKALERFLAEHPDWPNEPPKPPVLPKPATQKPKLEVAETEPARPDPFDEHATGWQRWPEHPSW